MAKPDTYLRQRGSAGVTVLLVMALLLTIGGAMLAVSSNEAKIAAGYRDGTAAQYAAEAGVKRTMALFDQNIQGGGQWNWLNTDVYLDNGKHNMSYNVKIKYNGSQTAPAVPPANGQYIVTSTGKANGAVRTVIVTLNVGGSGDGSGLDPNSPTSPFHYAGYSGGSASFQNAPAINGAPYGYGGAISGADGRNTVQVPYTSLNFPGYSTLAAIRDSNKPVYNNNNLLYNSSSGTYSVPMNATISNATIIVDGNLTLSDNTNYNNVNIFVTGKLSIGNVNFNGGNSLVVAGAEIQGTNNNNFGNAVVVAYGSATFTNSNIHGTIISAGASAFYGGANLNYDINVIQAVLGTSSGGISVGSWNAYATN